MTTEEADRQAYKRLRDRGLRPDRIEGCAAIEPTATNETLAWAAGLSEEAIVRQREAMADANDLTELLEERGAA